MEALFGAALGTALALADAYLPFAVSVVAAVAVWRVALSRLGRMLGNL
jgi:hypothetical protein